MHPVQGQDRVRVVVTGKGGVGKTVLTALLACSFARQGLSVIAVDGDPQQNLAAALGVPAGREGAIVPLSRQKDYIAEKTGAVPGRGGFLVLNPDTTDILDRFSFPAGEGIRLIVLGGVENAGSGCLCPEYTLLSAILGNAGCLPGDVVILDTPAGLEHFGRAVARGFSLALVVTDSSYSGMAVAARLTSLARECGIRKILLVRNMAGGKDGGRSPGEFFSGRVPRTFSIPADPVIREHDPSVVPAVERNSPAAVASSALARAILSGM